MRITNKVIAKLMLDYLNQFSLSFIICILSAKAEST